MAENLQFGLRRVGDLRDVAFGETAQHGNGGIVPHQTMASEELRQQFDRIVGYGVSSQIVDDERHAGDAGKAPEHSGGLRVFKMVQEQRGHREIEAAVVERQVHRIGANDFDLRITHGPRTRVEDRDLIEVQRDKLNLDPAIAGPANDLLRNVSRPRAYIEQTNTPQPCRFNHRKQMARQRAAPAEIAVNTAQIGQVLDVLGGGIFSAIYQL